METEVILTGATVAIVLIAFLYGVLKVNAYIINGWYQITRGEEKEQADGSFKSVGKIFYFVKKYFDRARIKHVRYQFAQLSLLLHHITSSTPILNNTVGEVNGLAFSVLNDKEWQKQKGSIEKRFGIVLEKITYEGAGTHWYQAHKIEKELIVPDWIGKPFINCVHCMASFHSTYVYWPIMIITFGFSWYQLIAWPFYMLALVTFNIRTFKDSNI